MKTLRGRLVLALLLAATSAWAALDLGPGGQYVVFQMGGGGANLGSWTSSDVTMNGKVAFLDSGPGGNNNTLAKANVDGNRATAPNWTISGTYAQVPQATLVGWADQLRTFSVSAAAFSGLPAIGDVTGAKTYTFTAANLAEPGTYIVNATKIALGGGEDLILDGSQLPAGSRVIVNVANSFALTGGGSILNAGGLASSQVLINYLGSSAAGISGGSDIFGTFLGPKTTANFNNASSLVYGSVLVDSVNFSSHLTINGEVFNNVPPVPEPSTYLAGALLLLPLARSAWRRLRRSR